jgi:hypothetical protein
MAPWSAVAPTSLSQPGTLRRFAVSRLPSALALEYSAMTLPTCQLTLCQLFSLGLATYEFKGKS